MSSLAVFKRLRAAGVDEETALLCAEAFDAELKIAIDAALEPRRAKDRERKRVPRNSAESAETLPKTKVSPTPPSKTQTIPTPSPPKGGSVPTKLAFDKFWLAYPRKIGKADARKAFDRAWRKLPPFEEEAILCGALERAKSAWTDPQFIPHAATWLNGERWTDEPEIPRKTELSGFAKWQIATGRA